MFAPFSHASVFRSRLRRATSPSGCSLRLLCASPFLASAAKSKARPGGLSLTVKASSLASNNSFKPNPLRGSKDPYGFKGGSA